MKKRLYQQHGMYGTQIYRAWQNIKNRCYKKNGIDYKNYGARGITMDEAWFSSFSAFYLGVKDGYEEGKSIDRINNEKGYVPGNIRWATREEQQNNTRRCIYYEYQGERLTLKQISRRIGMHYQTFMSRIKRWGSIEKAITQPLQRIDQDLNHLTTKL